MPECTEQKSCPHSARNTHHDFESRQFAKKNKLLYTGFIKEGDLWKSTIVIVIGMPEHYAIASALTCTI